MKRADALTSFLKESQEILDRFGQTFWKDLYHAKGEVLEVWNAGIGKLQEDQRLQQKVCTYIYNFMLRYDILNGNYDVHLFAFNNKYIFDEEAIKTVINLDFLFTDIGEIKQSLLKNSWKYRGKVTGYDVDHLILKIVMDCNWKICFLLRFMLREERESKEICQVLTANKQIIRWGEYRGRGETIFVSMQECFPQDTLLSLLDQNEKYAYLLQNSYHIDEICKDFKCLRRNLQFSRFIGCTFEKVLFDQSDLTGAYFKDCSFNGCSFHETILDLVTFENCKLQEITWDTAEFWGTYCNHTILEGRTPKQEQNSLQKKGDFNESIFLYGAGSRNCGLHQSGGI